jgi:2-hydroxy-3-keto-5-methylthiopentenyl-1-phosphate phosphatase
MKTAVQLDFDGTVTVEDVSFLLLDMYVGSQWREYLKEYTSGDISVGAFNKKVFGMMKADRKTMTDLVLNSDRVKVRPGLRELLDYCKEKDYKVGFKEAYTEMLCKEGYNVIYVGNGTSDIYPSRKAKYVCATADLLERCREEKLKCYPFEDFHDVIKALKSLKLS